MMGSGLRHTQSSSWSAPLDFDDHCNLQAVTQTSSNLAVGRRAAQHAAVSGVANITNTIRVTNYCSKVRI